jgi:molybdenum cofactor cytidylyltransferase
MGQLKQLLPIGGQPMVRHVTGVVCAAGLDQVVVVVGAQAAAVTQALAGLRVQIVANEAWSEGMSTSLRAGLHVLRAEIQAVLVVLADQPALTPGLLARLVDCHNASGAPLVVPVYRGRRGNPVLFARSLFPELLAIEGDRGGRALIDRYQREAAWLEVDDPAVLLDVDIPQDYENSSRR